MKKINKRLLTVKDASSYLSLGRTTIYKLMKSGELESFTIDSKRLFDVEDLDEFIDRLKKVHHRNFKINLN